MSGKPLPLPAMCARKMGKRVCREPCSVDLWCDSEVRKIWYSEEKKATTEGILLQKPVFPGVA